MRTLGVSIDEWRLLLGESIFYSTRGYEGNVFDDNNDGGMIATRRRSWFKSWFIARRSNDCCWTKWTRRSSLKWERQRLDSGIPRDGASRRTCWWSGSRLWWISPRLWGRPICRARLTPTNRWGRSRWPPFMAAWYSAIYFYRRWS